MSQLAQSTTFVHLEYLKLKNCQIGNEGFTAVVGAKGFRRVKVLIVNKNKISKLVFPWDDLKNATQV